MPGRKETLGEFVRRHREARGWGQTQLGKRAGMRQSYVSALESDEIAIPGRDKLVALARAFELKVEDFYRIAGVLEALPEPDPSTPEFRQMMEEFYRLHTEMNEVVERVRRRINDPEKFERWRRNTFQAWLANLRMAAGNALLDEPDPDEADEVPDGALDQAS